MRKEYGRYFLFLVCCILVSILISDSWVKGFAEYRSDWSKVPKCDYVTNRLVHDFYHEGKSGWYRVDKHKEFLGIWPKEIANRLIQGDTLRIGFDYYSEFGVCRGIVPLRILSKDFSHGQVYVYDFFMVGDKCKIKEVKYNE